MTEHLAWVNVGMGGERPDWRYVVVTYEHGKPRFDIPPRWATDGDVLAKEHSASQPAPTQECGF